MYRHLALVLAIAGCGERVSPVDAGVDTSVRTGDSGATDDVEVATWTCAREAGAFVACPAVEDALPPRPWASLLYASGWGTSAYDPYESVIPTLFDPDGDGDLDLFVTRYPAQPVLLERLADGWRRWPTAIPPLLGASEAVTTDINGDGFGDLLLVAVALGSPFDDDPDAFYDLWAGARLGDDITVVPPEVAVRVLLGGPDGLTDGTRAQGLADLAVPGDPTPFEFPGLTLEDVDDDDVAELVLRAGDDGRSRVLWLDGSGRIDADRYPDRAIKSQLMRIDLDGDDRRDDLMLNFAAAETGEVAMRVRWSDGRVEASPCAPPRGSPMGVDAGDVDLDGDLDLYIADRGAQGVCLAGQGSWFSAADALGVSVENTAAGPEITWSARVLDLDADGDEDLLATGAWETPDARWDQRTLVVTAQGGTFGARDDVALSNLGHSRALAVGDVDGDGCVDGVLGGVVGGVTPEDPGLYVLSNGLCGDRDLRFVPTLDADGRGLPGVEVVLLGVDGHRIAARSTGSGGHAGHGPVGLWLPTVGVTGMEVRWPSGRRQAVEGVPEVLRAVR